MALRVLNYQLFENVATQHDALENFKDFAVAQGWASQNFIKGNARWLGGSGFLTDGDESYLQIQSDGHDNGGANPQILHFRIRAEPDDSDALNAWWSIGGYKAGETTFDNTNFSHPVDRHNPGNVSPWNSTSRYAVSVKPTDIDKMWCIGDDTFLACVFQFSTDRINGFAIGSVDLKNAALEQGNIVYTAGTSGKSVTSKWYNNNLTQGLFDHEADCILFDDSRAAYKNTCVFSNDTPSGGTFSYASCVTTNDYAGVRPQIPMDIIVQDSDNLFFKLGSLPVLRVDVTGYQIGELVKYGATDEYLVFPNIYDTRVKGFSFKVG